MARTVTSEPIKRSRRSVIGMPARVPSGTGYLSGELPSGTTTVEGVPTQAEVRVLWRGPAGHPADGVLVAKAQSAPDGTWRVEGLSPGLRYDVVGRKDGFNDVIVSNVQPAV